MYQMMPMTSWTVFGCEDLEDDEEDFIEDEQSDSH